MNTEKMAEFVIPFASAILKLKHALDANEGVTLDAVETAAVVEALKMLRTPAAEQPQ